MHYRTLGRTGFRVSVAGLGTGGPSHLGQWTHKDETESHRVVHRALELGINLFDTSAVYGDTEAVLGRALKDVPHERYFVATKFLPVPIGSDEIMSADDVVTSCEKSLRRLGVETIDIFQFHSVVPQDYGKVVDRLYPTVERLKKQGKIRSIGITEYFFDDPAHKMLELALEDDLFDTIMVKYGIINPVAENRVLPMAKDRNVGVLNMSPVRVKLTRPEELEKLIRRLKETGKLAEDALPDTDPLGFLIDDSVRSVAAAGYKFGIGHEAVTSVLVGTGNPKHLDENVDALIGPPLSPENTAKIRAVFGKLAAWEGDTT